jgi:hypothetical protein
MSITSASLTNSVQPSLTNLGTANPVPTQGTGSLSRILQPNSALVTVKTVVGRNYVATDVATANVTSPDNQAELGNQVLTARALTLEPYPTTGSGESQTADVGESGDGSPLAQDLLQVDVNSVSTSVPPSRLLQQNLSTSASDLQGVAPILTPKDAEGNFRLTGVSLPNNANPVPVIQLERPTSLPASTFTRVELLPDGSLTIVDRYTLPSSAEFNLSNNGNITFGIQTAVTGDLLSSPKVVEPPTSFFSATTPNFRFSQVTLAGRVNFLAADDIRFSVGGDLRFRADQTIRYGFAGGVTLGDPKGNNFRLGGLVGANVFPTTDGQPGGTSKPFYEVSARLTWSPVAGSFTWQRIADTSTTMEGSFSVRAFRNIDLGAYFSQVKPDLSESTTFVGGRVGWPDGFVAPGVFLRPGGEIVPGAVVKFDF